ncbi:MAG: pyruvate kinase [Candidatus Pacebacteria bacterium]|nr:pyruvate kinase [Candidatus Paceibacterota bacterium]
MKKINRQTQIVATIGPASENALVLKNMLASGVNIFRFNLKHSTIDKHSKNIEKAKKVAKEQGLKVQILIDLPSPTFFESFALIAKTRPDYIALSYVKNSLEIKKFKTALESIALKTNIIVKIETNQALSSFASVLTEANSLMVARGDLGRSIPIEQVPFVQKEIIQAGNKEKKKVIVATEMLLSMILKKVPTRAEASDVANAVLDGCNAVMLSEETAIGKNPVQAVAIMSRIICEAESWKELGHLSIFSDKKKEFRFG